MSSFEELYEGYVVYGGGYRSFELVADEVQRLVRNGSGPFVVCVADVRVRRPSRDGKWTDSWSGWFGKTLTVQFIVSRKKYRRWFEEIPGQAIKVGASSLTKNWFDMHLRIKDETGKFRKELMMIAIDKNGTSGEDQMHEGEGRLHLLCDLHGIDIVKIPTVSFESKKGK
jgi:hypothetical protein